MSSSAETICTSSGTKINVALVDEPIRHPVLLDLHREPFRAIEFLTIEQTYQLGASLIATATLAEQEARKPHCATCDGTGLVMEPDGSKMQACVACVPVETAAHLVRLSAEVQLQQECDEGLAQASIVANALSPKHPDADPDCPTCKGNGYVLAGATAGSSAERAWCYCTPVGKRARAEEGYDESRELLNEHGAMTSKAWGVVDGVRSC